MNQYSSLVIKATIIKNTENFYCERKPSRATTRSTQFAVSKDKWQKIGGHW